MKNRNIKTISVILTILISINLTTLITNAHEITTYGESYLRDGEVTPTVGKKGTMFTYWVKYFDSEGAEPTIKQVKVKRPNGVEIKFDMTYLTGSSTKEGAIYYCTVVLREKGEFRFRFYFKNEDGEIACLPENENEYFSGPKVITDDEVEHYAVIICGGYGDDLQNCFERTSDLAYDTFKSLGYDDDHIYYLSRDTDNYRVDERVSRKSIKNTLTNWLGERLNEESKCFIYFCDHGDIWGNFIVNNLWVSDSEIADWIRDLKYKTLTIVMECCFSGQFIDDLSGSNRIIITSTNKQLSAYGNVHGYALFSESFFYALQKGVSYGEAWEEADKRIANNAYNENTRPFFSITTELNTINNKIKVCDNSNQIPLIDDNGDGVGHGTSSEDTLPLEGDGKLALKTYPGYNHCNSKEKNSLKKKIISLIGNLLKKPLFHRLLNSFF